MKRVIEDIDFLISAYQNLIDNEAESYRLVGEGVDIDNIELEELSKQSAVLAYKRLCNSLKTAKRALNYVDKVNECHKEIGKQLGLPPDVLIKLDI